MTEQVTGTDAASTTDAASATTAAAAAPAAATTEQQVPLSQLVKSRKEAQEAKETVARLTAEREEAEQAKLSEHERTVAKLEKTTKELEKKSLAVVESKAELLLQQAGFAKPEVARKLLDLSHDTNLDLLKDKIEELAEEVPELITKAGAAVSQIGVTPRGQAPLPDRGSGSAGNFVLDHLARASRLGGQQ